MVYKYIGVVIFGNEEDVLLVNKVLEFVRYNDVYLMLIYIDDGLSELYLGIYFFVIEDIF